MRLEGRPLSIRTEPRTGADVKRLIRELVLLGYRINEPEQSDSIFGDTTHEAVSQFQRDHRLRATGAVDEETAARINAALDERRPPERERPFVVSGIITRLGQPVRGVRVDAHDQDLRSAEHLGFFITNADGRYTIRYGADQFSRLEKGSADVRLTITAPAGAPIERFTARDADGNVLTLPLRKTPEARIDVEIDDTALDVSLYERLLAELTPLLGDVQVPEADAASAVARLAQLTSADIEFLARETERPSQEISVLVTAALAERRARSRQRGISAAPYYGLLRMGMGIDPAAILRAGRQGLSDALRRAIDDRVVPRSLEGMLESILTDLEELALNPPPRADGVELRIDARLSETLADETRRRSFRKLALEETRPVRELWTQLARQPGFEDAEVRERLETDLNFARVTLNHTPLASALRALPGVRTVRDLIRLDEEQWLSVMRQRGPDGRPIGPPASVRGESDDERARTYAQAIVGALTAAYPNNAVARIVARNNGHAASPVRAQVAAFLERADGFDIRRSDLDAYLRDRPDVLEGIGAGVREQVRAEVKRSQRLLTLTSGPEQLAKVMNTDIDSAYAVASQEKSQFTKSYGEVLGVATAHAMYEKAIQITNSNIWLLGGLKPQNVLNDPVVVGDEGAQAQVELAAELPNAGKLFGADDACGCEHCRSIYGPAAYLVTLLQFLEHSAPNAANKTAYDELKRRRPDIPALALTCANTDTPMPMIDRVNEILEAYVAAGALTEADVHDTGTATAADLAAAPQFTNTAAYVKLREATYARVLPYDDAWHVVSGHLAQLRTSRAEIMELYSRGALPSAVDLACERLGIPPAAAPLLTGAGVALAALLFAPGDEPANVVAALRPARDFLSHLGLTFEQATAVLGTRFVNPTGQMMFVGADGADPCDVGKMTVAALDEAALRRIVQLQRLQQRMGWSTKDIDSCLTSVSAAAIDGNSLIALSHVARLAAMFNRSPVDLLPLWSTLAPNGNPSTGAYTLLAEFVELDINELRALEKLSGEPVFTGPATILAFAELAREVKAGDMTVPGLTELIRAIPVEPQPDSPSALLRTLRAGFARVDAIGTTGGIEQRVHEVLTGVLRPDAATRLIELITGSAVLTAPLNAFPAGINLPDHLETRIGFDSEARALRVTGILAPAELAAARGAANVPAYRDALDLIAADAKRTMTESLAGLADDAMVSHLLNVSSFDGEGALDPVAIAQKLATLLETIAAPARAVMIDRLVEQTVSETVRLNLATIHVLARDVVPDAFADLRAAFDRGLSAAWYSDAQLAAEIGAGVDGVRDGTASLGTANAPANARSARWEGWLLPPTDAESKFIARASGEAQLWIDGVLVADGNGASGDGTDGTEARLTRSAAHRLRLEVTDATQPLAAAVRWWGPGSGPSPVPADALAPVASVDRFKAAERRIRRLARLIAALGLTARGVEAIWRLRADFGGLDVLLDPVDRADAAAVDAAAPARFAQWRKLQTFALAQKRQRGLPDLVDVLMSVTLADAQRDLALLDRRDPALIAAIVGPSGLNLGLAELRVVATLERVRKAASLATRLGAPPELLFTLATKAPDAATAEAVRAVARAAYDVDTWVTVSTAAQTKVRLARRDALLAYLKPRLGLATDHDCLAHFLIDVETGVEPPTSRIKEAISAIQHFVPLCLSGAVSSVSPDAIDADRWNKSLRYYRVQEAACRVFIDTPDFIEEELRDDKSEFFDELEAKLRQGELTPQRVEDAIRGYLWKLEAIARPQVLAMCHDPASGRLHVFARTMGEPPVYYHRWREPSGVWSGWRTLPLDIGGNQLIPVIWSGRLFLFWPLAEEGRTKKTQKKPDGSDEEVEVVVQRVRLAWSSFRGERWEAKKTMPRAEVLVVELNDIERLSFAAVDVDGRLRIECTDPTGIVVECRNPVGPTDPSCLLYDATPWLVVDRIGWFEAADRLSPIRARPAPETLHVADSRNFAFTTSVQLAGVVQLGSSGDFQILLRRSHGTVTFTSLRDPAQVRPGEAFVVGDDIAAFIGVETSVSDPDTAYPLPGLGQYFGEYGSKQIFEMASPSWVSTPISGTSISTRALTAIAQARPAAPEFEPVPADLAATGVTSMQLRLTPKVGAAQAASEPPLSFAEKSGAVISGVAGAGWENAVTDVIAPTNSVLSVRLEPFYHPFAHELALALDIGGPEALFTEATQRLGDAPEAAHAQLHFATTYEPSGSIKLPYPRRDVDFTPTGAYSLYNREIFFHIPALVLEMATRQGELELAERYGGFVFDETPTSAEPSPERHWQFVPFKTAPRDRISSMLEALHRPPGDPMREGMLAQIAEWRRNPFQPHRIARARPVAYMKYFVFKHLEHRIAKGDRPFRRRTLEANNEASQVYMAAAVIARPVGEDLPAREPKNPESYSTLRNKQIDAFGNALVELESKFPFVGGAGNGGGNASASVLDASASFYFCIPKSRKLQSYWDTIRNRLFNLRHGRDIDGVPQTLALFEPQIDPMVLVRAAAKGRSLQQVLDDLAAPPPNVRYRYALQQARELANQAIAFRQALLQAEERHDSEELTALLASQQADTLKAIRFARTKAVDAVREEVKALRQSLRPIQREFEYYRDIEKAFPYERTQLQHLERANRMQGEAGMVEVFGQELNLIPTVSSGTTGSSVSFGGSNVGAYFHAVARGIGLVASELTFRSTQAGIIGALNRTRGEWALHRDVADLHRAHIEQQIIAREIQGDVAQSELDTHELQLEHARMLVDYHRDKHTEVELYSRLASEARHVLGRAYKLARTWATWAVRAAESERGPLRQSFDVPPLEDGRLDTMAPERLLVELGELDKAVHETKAYDYLLVKQVSLLLHDPLALIALKETGVCEFELPESLFDADYPGHYNRRIQSVSVTIPSVVGPYVGINATLTLLWSKTRISADVGTKYQEQKEDPRFAHRHVARRAIALSTGQNDDGMPELKFADDGQDGYGPFVNGGAISRWRLEMAHDCNAFDVDAVSDCILKLTIAAHEGGALLREKAREAVVTSAQKGLVRLISVKHEFPNAWHTLMSPPSPAAIEQTAELALDRNRFSMRLADRKITPKAIEVFLDFKEQGSNEDYTKSEEPLPVTVGIGAAPPKKLTLNSSLAMLGGMPWGRTEIAGSFPNTLRIAIAADDVELLAPELISETADEDSPLRLNRERLNDILVLVRFDASAVPVRVSDR